MGNSSSSREEDTTDDYAKFDGIETLGYRVLGVQPDSPASTAGLVSFLDFLVGVNGKMLLGSGEGLEEGDEYDDIDLPALLRENIGNELELCKCNIGKELFTQCVCHERIFHLTHFLCATKNQIFCHFWTDKSRIKY
jgi:hypothetical protein